MVSLQLLFLHNLLGSGQIRSWSDIKNADTDIQQLRSPALGQSYYMLPALWNEFRMSPGDFLGICQKIPVARLLPVPLPDRQG